MYKNIIDKLICPLCSTGLNIKESVMENDEIIKGVLVCEQHHEWRIHDGVLNFNSEEQEIGNNWTQMYEEHGYKELDALIMSKVAKVQLDGYNATFEYLKNQFKDASNEWVIDIATGRGMLLLEMVKNFNKNLNIVCTDLSHIVLKYDRLKCLEINPNMKVNFIACDATNLPVRNESMDRAVSFVGIANMLDIAEKGIKESMRVTKKGLLNVGIVIKDDNPQIENLNNMIKEAGHDFTIDYFMASNFVKLHQVNKTVKVNSINVFEGIAEKSDDDLIPVEGEWFAMAVVEVKD